MEHFERLENKIDKISDQIGEINVTLAAQHVSLKEHIKRTNAIEDKLMPIVIKRIEFNGIMKFIGWVAGILTIGAAIVEILEYIKK